MPKFSSFSFLNITQFLTALNDNLYKLLLIFFLISLRGESESTTILSLAGAVFVIPFLLFASLAGSLADRLSKRSIIYFTRISEILTTCLGVLAFFFQSEWGGYGVLFLLAIQSAIFSPCKYGIIPEIVSTSKISHYNGILAATTYLAIIIGTFLASFLTQVLNNFVFASIFCVFLAFLGFISTLGIEKTLPQARKKKISTSFIYDVFRTLQQAKKQRYLVTTLIFGAYFLFVGAYIQLNIIPFTFQSLHLSDVQGGYLFLMTAIGIGIGSYLAGQSSGKDIELGFIPIATFGMMLCFLGLFIFSSYFIVVVILLIILGICGGFYIVPADAFIQKVSPDQDRGQNVAAGNFLSFVGVILSSGLLAFVGNGLKLTAAQGFLIIGGITFFVGIALLVLYAGQVLRLLATIYARLFLKIHVKGNENLNSKKMLLVAPYTSWWDMLIMMSTLPRMITYIVPLGAKKRKNGYRLLGLIPIDAQDYSFNTNEVLDIIKRESELNYSVCVMHPSPQVLKWKINLQNIHESFLIRVSKFTNKNKSMFKQIICFSKSEISITFENLIDYNEKKVIQEK